MTDTDLARRTCEMLGWEYAGADAAVVRCFTEGDALVISWPDLSAAALRHVEAQGWKRLSVQVDDFDTTWVGLRRRGREGFNAWQEAKTSVDGLGSTALYKALCAAACQTQDGEEQ